VRLFRRHVPDLLRLRRHPLVVERRELLVSEAKTTLRHVAALGGAPAEPSAPLASLARRLADPDVLLRAMETGVMAAPGIFHRGYAAARDVVTAPIAHGFIECLDPQTGAVRREAERLGLLAARGG
jgi:hypothetical protein